MEAAGKETKLPLRDKIAALVRSETSASGSYENCPYKEAWLEVADRILALVAEQSECALCGRSESDDAHSYSGHNRAEHPFQTKQASGDIPPHDVCENSRDCIDCGKRIAPAGGLCFGCATDDEDEPDHVWHGSDVKECPPTCKYRKAGDNG